MTSIHVPAGSASIWSSKLANVRVANASGVAMAANAAGTFVVIALITLGYFILKVEDIDRSLAAILTLNTIAHTVGAIGVGAQAGKMFGKNQINLYVTTVSYESLIAAAMTLAAVAMRADSLQDRKVLALICGLLISGGEE